MEIFRFHTQLQSSHVIDVEGQGHFVVRIVTGRVGQGVLRVRGKGLESDQTPETDASSVGPRVMDMAD